LRDISLTAKHNKATPIKMPVKVLRISHWAGFNAASENITETGVSSLEQSTVSIVDSIVCIWLLPERAISIHELKNH
jgi:hypothetical protein